ncbi:MAG: pSer/pThr/pTyr-binding forkhead associated (FHA) protein [Patiriisocius sp.]|jgi:pSer/pThr/pTyr-binding forkhead associated (FHA) protein
MTKDKPIGQFVAVFSDITSIGRKSGCDISVKDPAVSGSHAQIQKLGKNFVIHVDGGKDKDREPLLNGGPTGFMSHKLEHKDKIQVADTQTEYQLV